MFAGLVVIALLSSQASLPTGDSVMLGVRITPDTVTVGAPFQVLVRIRAPRGSRIEFSLGPTTKRRICDS